MRNLLLGAFLVLALLLGVLHASVSWADVSDGGSGVIAVGDHLTVFVAPDPASTLATSYSITGETNHAHWSYDYSLPMARR